MAAAEEVDLVLAAAEAWGAEPADLVATCDVVALVRIAAEAEQAPTPGEAAASVLVGLARLRPFRAVHRGHGAAAWLAAADLLDRHGLEIDMDAIAARDLVHRAASGRLSVGAAADVLAPCVRPKAGRRRRPPRTAATSPGRWRWRCPVCDRSVAVSRSDHEALAWLGAGQNRPVLVALCARQHGAHGRRGDGPPPRRVPARLPGLLPVVRSPVGPASAFLVPAARGAVVFLPGPAGVTYDVVVVDDPLAGDLAGDWSRLRDRGEKRVTLPARAVHVDAEDDLLDVARLAQAQPRMVPLLEGSAV